MKRCGQGKRNNGFTFVETLAAVAVLVILLGLGSVAAAYYRDYLRITELDNAAREIYMAAEHRAVLLAGSQRLSGLVSGEGRPVQLSAAAGDGETDAYYVSSEDISAGVSGGRALLDAGSIDPALWDGYFYVVYEPVSGSVTDVFYAEEPIETLAGSDFQQFYDEWTVKPRLERMRSTPMLGYYGGGMAEGQEAVRLDAPDVTVMIHNEEKLTLEVTFRIPASAQAVPGLNTEREVRLEYGGAQPLYLLRENTEESILEKNGRLPAVRTDAGGGAVTYTWVLDSLEEKERFAGLFSGGPGTYGGDFRVSAKIRLSADGYRPSQAQARDENNSLFAKGSDGETARVQFLRHLQNLDSEFSKVSGKARAVQTDRIYCADNETYPGYEFRPIENPGLSAYDGGGLEIYGLLVTPESAGARPAGLFSAAGDLFGKRFSFTGLRLVNATVRAGTADEAGALVGIAENAGFDDCRVYWEATEEHPDLRELLGSDAGGPNYEYRIRGNVAGGLAGRLKYTNTVANCFAATLVEGRDAAGGLLGAAGGSLEVSNSYGDCYLTGRNAAGLIGSLDASVYLTDCYAAGFIYTTDGTAAGLCLGGDGKTYAENVYSAMCYPAAGDGKAVVYGLTQRQGDSDEGVFQKTFFLRTAGQTADGEQWARSYADMTDRDEGFCDEMGGAFAWKSAGNTRPYNLREHLNLVNYSFPGLAGLPHYGDWGAQFQEPSLVYFEEYEVKNPGDPEEEKRRYGFSGGNARYLSGIGQLDNERTIRSDGYAVALLQSDLGSLPDEGYVRVTYWDAGGSYWDGVKDAWTSGGGAQAVSVIYRKSGLAAAVWKNDEGSEAEYYLLPLPAEMVNTAEASEHFFQYLRFALAADGTEPVAGEYFYNPHFAETVIPYVPEETEEGGAAPEWDAEAADRYAGEELVEAGRRNTASVRTPRHLYELSRHREYYSSREHRYTFRQELHLDYGTYTGYGLFARKPFQQTPIGSWNEPFHGVYDGGCRRISGVTFYVPEDSERFYAGLFGYSAGTLRDIVYEMDPEQAVTVAMDNGSQSLYVGALAGGNAGTVSNCAVSGVSLTGYSFGSTIYVGGLTGQNSGTIRNSAAECASLSADCSSYARAYVGGLAGRNDASREIAVSYAVGKITATVDSNSSARICGFVGYNAGSIRSSYAAVDLESTGQQVEAYGFCGVRSGSQAGTYYLNEGNFTYRETSYAASYQRADDKAAGVKYPELTEADSPFPGPPVDSELAAGMKVRREDGVFPYPTGVKDAAGQPAHYGDWPRPMELGEMGIYYWEELVIGGESTFHVSMLAVEPKENTVTKQSTLSTAHNDGGVVTGYGYGYYAKEAVEKNVGFSAERIGYTGYVPYKQRQNLLALSNLWGDPAKKENEPTVERTDEALGVLMPGYVFYSWSSYHEGPRAAGDTGDPNREARAVPGLCLFKEKAGDTLNPNDGVFRLEQNGYEIAFRVNPQFADSMSVKTEGVTLKNRASSELMGSEGNPFQVRCGMQLQEINWYDTAYTDVPVGYESYTSTRFPYLSGVKDEKTYHWVQTHDMDWTGEGNVYTEDGNTYPGVFFSIAQTQVNDYNLRGWFSGNYDGGGYTMKNFNIGINTQNYDVNCMGLFGVVQDAVLEDIVMFSEQGNDVVTVKGRKAGTAQRNCWYAGGALVGLARESTVSNCAVAGYTIVDEAAQSVASPDGAVGGAIGGLVGMTDMELEGCMAANTIRIANQYTGYTVREQTGSGWWPQWKDVWYDCHPVRVGGLVGSTASTVRECYTGGSIDPSKAASQVRAGGVSGGAGMVALDGSNAGTSATVTDCYTYADLPEGGKNTTTAPVGHSEGGTVTVLNSYYLSEKADAAAGAVTYRQLAGQEPVRDGRTIYQLLNDCPDLPDPEARKRGPFYPVTSEIDGFAVSGKYSYPPSSRPELQGIDYPFPTVLTRDRGVYHVHYGEWPLIGIKRAGGNGPIALDLYAKPEHLEALTLEGVPSGGQWLPVESGDEAVATGTVTGGQLRVAAEGEGTTKLTVKYQSGGVTYSLVITVNVTAYLELRPGTAAMFPGSSVELAMTPWGRTPVSDGAAEMALALQGLELVSVSSGSASIHAAIPEADRTHLLLTAGADAVPAEAPEVVGVGYTYPHKDTEQPHTLAVTVLALPEAVWKDGTCTVDFSGDFAGHSVTELSAALPEGADPAVTVKAEKGVITLEGVPEGQAAPELTITLTMDGLVHTVAMTPERTAEAGGTN